MQNNPRSYIINSHIRKSMSVDGKEFLKCPEKEEAMKAFNTLVGYCSGKGLPEGDYKTEELFYAMIPYVNSLTE